MEENSLIPPPTELFCEYAVNPLGVDVAKPRLSWTLNHEERGRMQSAYQILVASWQENIFNDVGDMWDSGKVYSNKSTNIEYGGKLLESCKTYYWKVRWWDDKGRISPWSKIATFETGILHQEEWKARWISGGNLLRHRFILNGKVKSARAYVSGLGYYELRINGEKVGDRHLDPAWTDYEKVVLYSTYDVSNMLRDGENVVGIILGNGRYNVKPHRRNSFKHYGDPRAILQMRIELTNGEQVLITTNEEWRAAKGPILEDDIYDGETYDARLEPKGWDLWGYDDSEWDQAKIVDPPGGRLVSQATFPPIRAIRTVQPVNITNPKPGVFVFDFGQNFTGWVRIIVSGARGTVVKLRFAEILNSDGTINTAPNVRAACTDTYILRGEGLEVYEPRFTYHGFRYVEVTGFPGVPNIFTLQGIVVHTDVRPSGSFLCSNQLVNSIHKNILWSQLSNLMSIPTDCPQRAERMGWLGDAQLTAEEAIYNFYLDMASFYTKWLRDIALSQKEDGSLPDVAPPYWNFYPADPAWGTACIIIPWNLFLYYGDVRVLQENYGVMKKWVDFLNSKAEDYILKFSKYGDWCQPGQVRSSITPGEVVSTLCYYEDILLLSNIARIIGKEDESKKYMEMAEKIKESFNKKYLKDGYYQPLKEILESTTTAAFSQTANCIPLFLDITPPEFRESVLKKLIDDITRVHDYHINTGIIGTRYLLETLTKFGHAETAYRILTQTTYPSWGYMIKEGATTLWERWEFLAGAGMNSHNHIMFGSIDVWLYKAIAGINADPENPGFEKIVIKPQFIKDLNHAGASINTHRGLIVSKWWRDVNSLMMEISIPVNSKAEVHIPLLDKNQIIKENEKVIWREGQFICDLPEITFNRIETDRIVLNVGSGNYHFKIECLSKF
ncbi:MAG: family 78 glycoside hydrolase catalytic domain [Nitrososphaerota archaeon]|nr:glycoside hydrolase family 78 protein [Candidatus Bathyarchaeota archaeon]MDW8048695.1 family 78 glycoside hydrolase catalytic domain [Nitrososphaerota archaeon]